MQGRSGGVATVDQGFNQIPRGACQFQVEQHTARIAARDVAGEAGGKALERHNSRAADGNTRYRVNQHGTTLRKVPNQDPVRHATDLDRALAIDVHVRRGSTVDVVRRRADDANQCGSEVADLAGNFGRPVARRRKTAGRGIQRSSDSAWPLVGRQIAA